MVISFTIILSLLLSLLAHQVLKLNTAEQNTLQTKARNDTQAIRRNVHEQIKAQSNTITNDEYMFEYINSLLQPCRQLTRSSASLQHTKYNILHKPKATPSEPTIECVAKKTTKVPSDDVIPLLSIAS